MFNDHSIHDVYGHTPLGDNEINKPVSVADTPKVVETEFIPSLSVEPQQAELDGADAASQRIFTYVIAALSHQEASGKVDGVTYEDIQDNTRYGYSFVKNRMAEILEMTNRIKVEPGSGRRPSRFFLPHQYLERQSEKGDDSAQPSARSGEDEDYDDEQAARKTVLASMKRERERLTKIIEEAQSELKDRESAIRILEKDIHGG